MGDGRCRILSQPCNQGRRNPVGMGWVTVAAGYYHSLAIKADGTLWAWGDNNHGQLGDGTTAEGHSPVHIGSDTDWVMVSAGYLHSLAIKADGTLWAWGYNGYGQLGLGHDDNQHSPAHIRFSKAMPWLYLLLLSD